jgi:hypothetical protein
LVSVCVIEILGNCVSICFSVIEGSVYLLVVLSIYSFLGVERNGDGVKETWSNIPSGGQRNALHSDSFHLLRCFGVSVTRWMVRILVDVPVVSRLAMLHACRRRVGSCMGAHRFIVAV